MRKNRSRPLLEPGCVRVGPLFGIVTGRNSGMAVLITPDWAATVRLVEPHHEHPDRHDIGNRTYIVAPVEPLDVDGVQTVAVGVGLWFVAFVVLLPFYGRLADAGSGWLLWTCLAGFGLGLIGLAHCRSRASRLRN